MTSRPGLVPAADPPVPDPPAADPPAEPGAERTVAGHAADRETTRVRAPVEVAAGIPSTAVPDGVDPLSFRVFQAFMRTMRSHGQLMIRILGEEGAHPGQAFCLRILARHDGMRQSDLAATLHVSRPTVTSMLQRMERAGTVRRVVDEEDQRVTRVHLTDAGRELERELTGTLLSYSGRILDPIPADDRRELERLLGLMADNIAVALAERTEVASGVDREREVGR
jgi:DNA-binding MarR family transcriptional regulator